MKKVLSAVLAYLMLHTGALGLTPQKEAEPASHIYFVYSEVSDGYLGYIKSKEKIELPKDVLVAELECATVNPSVKWRGASEFIIRDDMYFDYDALTGEKTVIDELDTEKHFLMPLSVNVEHGIKYADSFPSHRYFRIMDKSTGKEALFDVELKQFLTDFQFDHIEGASTHVDGDAEFLYGRGFKQAEDEYGVYDTYAATIFRTEPFEVFYDGGDLRVDGCFVSSGKIVFYDKFGSGTLVSSGGNVLHIDERCGNCCLLPDGNFVLSGGKQFYVYDTDLNLVHESQVYDSTNEVISTKGIVEEHGYSEHNYITVVKDGVLILTDAYETFSAPVCRLDDKIKKAGMSDYVTTEASTLIKEYVLGYEVQTRVDEDGLPVFTESKIPETVPICVYLFVRDNSVPEDTAGRGILYGYDPENGTFIKILTSGRSRVFE